MAIIALTGGICSGKSMVTEILQDYLPIIDADIIARGLLSEPYQDLTNTSPSIAQQAIQQVIKCFGLDILNSNKYIDRKRLRDLVFDTNQEIAQKNKTQLDAIIHPLVYQEIWQQVDKLKQTNEHIVIAIPLLRETLNNTEIEEYFDLIWVIDCDEKEQIKRCLKRDNCNPEVIEQMINLQASREERLKIADLVITNNGSIEDLKECMITNYQNLISQHD